MNDLRGKTIRHPFQDDDVTYVRTAADTNGKETVLDIVLHPKGAGPPLHYHKQFSEKFEILEGEMKVQSGKKVRTYRSGEEVTAEKGELHRFWSESDKPVKFRVTLSPAHEGFENTLAITYGLARDGHMNRKGVPKNFRHIALLATMSDTNAPGFYSLIFGFLRFLAKRKKSQKIQAELIERYCM